MSYLDKVAIGGTTYDLQDTKAQEDLSDVQSELSLVEGIRDSETISINTLLEIVRSTSNGATYSDRVLTVPVGETGYNSTIGYRVINDNFNQIKGQTVTIEVGFTVSDSLADLVLPYVALNGTGYTVNSSTYSDSKVTANITINSDATSGYVVVGLRVNNTTEMAEAGTITLGTGTGSYVVHESYEDAIKRISEGVAADVVAEDLLTDMTTLNLFDKTKANTTGMYDDSGNFITNSYQYSTGLIPIGNYTVFSMNRDQSTIPCWTLWEADGTTLVRGVQARSITISEETDSDAVYVRSSFLATEIDTLMIIPNAHPCMSGYFPFNSPRKAIKGEWNGKLLVTIGDSLTQMGFWQEMVTQMLGMTYEVAAQSGGNMTSIANFVDNIEAADVMTVWAGTNDWYGGVPLGTLLNGDGNTYYGAVQHVCEEVSTNLPGCKLLLITPLQRNTTNTAEWEEDSRGFKINATTGKTLEDYANAVLETAEIYGIPVLDMFHAGGVNKINIDAWTTDKLHPGKAQFERLAWKIIGKINDM